MRWILPAALILAGCTEGGTTSSAAIGANGEIALINGNDVIVLPGKIEPGAPVTVEPIVCSAKSHKAGEC